MNNTTTTNYQFNPMRRRLHDNNNVWTGLILLVIGSVFLLKKMHLPMPYWIFSWETVFIVVGIIIGIRRQFQGFLWFVFILIGTISLVDDLIPGLNIRHYSWPVIMIIAGLYFIMRPNRRWNKSEPSEPVDNNYKADPVDYTEAETIDATAIFGSVKKVVVSKNFKGGELVSIMGGTEINFSQADIHGRVRLEATNFMGGTKLIIPPTWDVQSEMVAIFGGVEDKRDTHSLNIDKSKVLVLEGTCVFGGLEIKSF